MGLSTGSVGGSRVAAWPAMVRVVGRRRRRQGKVHARCLTRGGALAIPPGHARATYRVFIPGFPLFASAPAVPR